MSDAAGFLQVWNIRTERLLASVSLGPDPLLSMAMAGDLIVSVSASALIARRVVLRTNSVNLRGHSGRAPAVVCVCVCAQMSCRRFALTPRDGVWQPPSAR
jgi:hypothetical protein